jgi:hypothetical protein
MIFQFKIEPVKERKKMWEKKASLSSSHIDALPLKNDSKIELNKSLSSLQRKWSSMILVEKDKNTENNTCQTSVLQNNSNSSKNKDNDILTNEIKNESHELKKHDKIVSLSYNCIDDKTLENEHSDDFFLYKKNLVNKLKQKFENKDQSFLKVNHL